MTSSFASIRIITEDVAGLAAFYERTTGLEAAWGNPQFAEIRTGAATLAIAGTATLALFGADVARAAANATVIVEFFVDDVDEEFARLRDGLDLVQEPTTMPWGNRSLLFRDPDGNLVNLFTPVTPEALRRFRGE